MKREIIPFNDYMKGNNPTNVASHVIDQKVKIISADQANKDMIGALLMIETSEDQKVALECILYYGFMQTQTLLNEARNYRTLAKSKHMNVCFFECVSVGDHYFGVRDVTEVWNQYLNDADRLKELF